MRRNGLHPGQRDLFERPQEATIHVTKNVVAEPEVLPEWIRPEEAARRVGVSRSTIYRWASEGRVRAAKPGAKTMLIDTVSLFDFIERSTDF